MQHREKNRKLTQRRVHLASQKQTHKQTHKPTHKPPHLQTHKPPHLPTHPRIHSRVVVNPVCRRTPLLTQIPIPVEGKQCKSIIQLRSIRNENSVFGKF